MELIRGDMNATAMGTVTWVDGNSVIAFGHPMFGMGEVNLPLVTGEVHTFIPSLANSFKLATPLVEVGRRGPGPAVVHRGRSGPAGDDDAGRRCG